MSAAANLFGIEPRPAEAPEAICTGRTAHPTYLTHPSRLPLPKRSALKANLLYRFRPDPRDRQTDEGRASPEASRPMHAAARGFSDPNLSSAALKLSGASVAA